MEIFFFKKNIFYSFNEYIFYTHQNQMVLGFSLTQNVL